MQHLFETHAKILDKKYFTDRIFALTLHAPEIANLSQPGHFVMLRLSNWGNEPALNRPMSIARADKKNGTIEIQILITGKGSSLISESHIADTISVIGPLGNTFSKPENIEHVALVGGGIGIAPLIFLKEQWGSYPKSMFCAYGAASKSDFIPEEFTGPGFISATDDGSYGYRGFVTDLLIGELKRNLIDRIYACGPNPMLETIQSIAEKYNVKAEISIETIMACGYGLCLGCVVESRKMPGTYMLACKDGPVFNSNEINLK